MTVRATLLSMLLLLPFAAFSSTYIITHKSQSNCLSKNFNLECEFTQQGPVNFDDQFSLATGLTYIPIHGENVITGEVKLSKDSKNGQDIILGEISVDNQKLKNIAVTYVITFKNDLGQISQSKGSLHISRSANQKVDLGEVMSAQDITLGLKYDLFVSITTE